MNKVLIVDDESMIRKGLINVIDWKSIECEICGEAGDGIEGMELIKKVKPDIVITDIKMPGIDGLAMIKETKEIIPDGKIVILTGFRDFDYIQEAIKLGAFDYILKPSRIEDITSIVKRAVNEINIKKHKDEELNNLKMEFEKKIPVLRQKFLYDIMFKIIYRKEDIDEQLELYDLHMNNFILMMIETDEEEYENPISQYEKQLYQFGIINTFKESFEKDFTIYNIALTNHQIVFIVQPEEMREDTEETVFSNINNLKNIISNCFDFTITVSVSTWGKGIMELSQKMKEVSEAMQYKFYMGKNSVILFDDIKSFCKSADFSILDNCKETLLESVKAGNEKNVKLALDEIMECINKYSMDKDSVKVFYWNLINSVNSIPVLVNMKETQKLDDMYRMDVYKLIEKCSTAHELNDILEGAALKITSKINLFNQKTINSTLQRAIDYINNHYSESITLNDTAEYAYVSTYYLSRMFTKELGKNFVDYLNETKIEKAKEFLKNTQYKTYEIAEMVGVKDAHYFSKLFKKYTGTTPSEYRDGGILK